MPNEIITLQLGHYSNYIGTHWWNIQESSFRYDEEGSESVISHDVLFREGQNKRGDVTFTPRLVLVDLNGSLGTLPIEGTLYNSSHCGQEEGHFMWDENVELHESAPVPSNQYLKDLYEMDSLYEEGFSKVEKHPEGYTNGTSNTGLMNIKQNGDCPLSKTYHLDNKVRTWSDFKGIHYHPRSTLLLNKHFQNSDRSTFDTWISGMNESKSGNVMHQIEETIRFYAEECDYMQGFHILTDMNDGFGGLTCVVAEYLQDEFLGKSRVCFPTLPVLPATSKPAKVRNHALSTILTMSGLLNFSSFICPLSLSNDMFKFSMKARDFPHLIYDASSRYHTSAILAASLEAATCIYRQRDGVCSLSHLVDRLTSNDRKLLGFSTALPLPYDVERYSCLPDLLCDYVNTSPWIPLTPGVDGTGQHERCFAQSVTLNGLHKDEAIAHSYHERYQQTGLHQCTEPNSIIKLYLEERFPSCRNTVNVMSDPITISSSFPHIFSTRVQSNGFLKPHLKPRSGLLDPYTDILLNGGTGELKTSPRSSAVADGFSNLELGGSFSNGWQCTSRESACHDGEVKKKTQNTNSIPMMTNIASSSLFFPLLEQCHRQASILKRWVARNQHSDAGVEAELLEEATEKFLNLQQDYSAI